MEVSFWSSQNFWKSNFAVTWDQVYYSVKASSVRSVNQYSWLTSWLTLSQHSINTWSALNQQMCSSWLHTFCKWVWIKVQAKTWTLQNKKLGLGRYCDKALHIATTGYNNFFTNIPILHLHIASSQVKLEITKLKSMLFKEV